MLTGLAILTLAAVSYGAVVFLTFRAWLAISPPKKCRRIYDGGQMIEDVNVSWRPILNSEFNERGRISVVNAFWWSITWPLFYIVFLGAWILKAVDWSCVIINEKVTAFTTKKIAKALPTPKLQSDSYEEEAWQEVEAICSITE